MHNCLIELYKIFEQFFYKQLQKYKIQNIKTKNIIGRLHLKIVTNLFE